MNRAPLPVGFGLRLNPAARRTGVVVWGGAPWRLLRLSAVGAGALDRILSTGVDDRRDGVLARRLVDAGLADPVPPAATTTPTVVVPVHDRAGELDRCLTALAGADVVVVDDGSVNAAAVAAVADWHRARLIRRNRCEGPGSARNRGLASIDGAADVVAFVDSDCRVDVNALRLLAGHLADPTVAVAAPRVVPAAASRRTVLARFAAARSPLDVGLHPADVRPDGRITYVPSTVLVARRAALDATGGFDESLRTGEDVDLCWRLHDAGWSLRYDPTVRAWHAEPATWRDWLERRRRYGTSAGPLARRHDGRLRGPALAGLAAPISLLRRHDAELPLRARAAIAVAPVRTTVAVCRWAVPLWWPVATAAARRPAPRRLVAMAFAVTVLDDWRRRRPRLDPLRYAVASLADDIAYGVGVWAGCVRARNVEALLPRLSASRRRSDP